MKSQAQKPRDFPAHAWYFGVPLTLAATFALVAGGLAITDHLDDKQPSHAMQTRHFVHAAPD